MKRRVNGFAHPATQRGAVLYIALIMLVLLALIGIVGMQVSSMQERMSANYRAVNIAFQGAEGVARLNECALEHLVNRTGNTDCGTVTPVLVCDDGFDPVDWVRSQGTAAAPASNVRLIGPCISGNTSLDMGSPVNEDPSPIYQVTAYATDVVDLATGTAPVGANPTSAAAIDTIFRP